MKNDYISDIHKKDKLILHPYENLKERGTYNRKLIVKSDNIYLYDEDGKRYIDGPGGMWCNNIGHGNKEIAEAIKNQIEKMDYCSPFSESNETAAELASVLSEVKYLCNKYRVSMFLVGHHNKGSDEQKDLHKDQIQGGKPLTNFATNVFQIHSSTLSRDLFVLKITKPPRDESCALDNVPFKLYWRDESGSFNRGAIINKIAVLNRDIDLIHNLDAK